MYLRWLIGGVDATNCARGRQKGCLGGGLSGLTYWRRGWVCPGAVTCRIFSSDAVNEIGDELSLFISRALLTL